MTSRAVVIGPANYHDKNLPSHAQIGTSVRMYEKALAADDRWRSNHRILNQDELETSDTVMRALEQEARKADQPEDMLLVIYVGHGAYWDDIPGAQVHFAVGSSFEAQPWTWLSSWYLYRAMRRSKAKLKVLIADCCYSNMLPHLGPAAGGDSVPGVLGRPYEGTCVFTAVKNNTNAKAFGCPKLPGELKDCTPFSGHLLNVVADGTTSYHSILTAGLLRDAVQRAMDECDTPHDKSRMLLNDAPESIPLFTNQRDSADRDPQPSVPVDPRGWADTLKAGGEFDIKKLRQLLVNPRMTGEVVALLYADVDERPRDIALRINSTAHSTFTSPRAFAKYWTRAEPAFRR